MNLRHVVLDLAYVDPLYTSAVASEFPVHGALLLLNSAVYIKLFIDIYNLIRML